MKEMPYPKLVDYYQEKIDEQTLKLNQCNAIHHHICATLINRERFKLPHLLNRIETLLQLAKVTVPDPEPSKADNFSDIQQVLLITQSELIISDNLCKLRDWNTIFCKLKSIIDEDLRVMEKLFLMLGVVDPIMLIKWQAPVWIDTQESVGISFKESLELFYNHFRIDRKAVDFDMAVEVLSEAVDINDLYK